MYFIKTIKFSDLCQKHENSDRPFFGPPVEPIPPIKVTRQELGILAVEEAETLFRANEHEDPEICGLLALGAFGGMRASAIERLSHGEIKLDEWAILTPAEKTKKRRRNYIEGLPGNLYWRSKSLRFTAY
jgi:hypothetical protein